jgi:dipeptidyl aminopeptidase/acylaminoacyl peptidase
VDPNKTARATADGARYAIYEYDNRRESTTLTVKRTADGAVLHRRSYDGYLRDLKPSPREASQVLARYSDDVGDPTVFIALDLTSSNARLETFAASTAAVDWLSDGRVVAVGNTGTLSAGLPGGAREVTGRVDLLGRTVRHIAVHPESTRLLLGLVLVTGRNNVSGSDLWLTDLDGSDTVRFTNTNISSIGVWSPDGERIAFDVDTGTVCIGAQCSGTCEIWHAPAQATMLNPLAAAPGTAARFSVLNRQGSKRTLGCRLLRWTP